MVNKTLEKFQKLLTNDIIQRICYGFLLASWTLLLWERLTDISSSSSIGLSYSTIYLIPASLLLIQIILNHGVLWLLVFSLYSVYILISIYMTIHDIIERSGNHVKAINWHLKDVAILVASFGFAVFVGILIYCVKPRNKALP